MLEQRDEQIRLLQEENLDLRKQNFIKRIGRKIYDKEYREASTEKYKMTEDFRKKMNNEAVKSYFVYKNYIKNEIKLRYKIITN